MCVARDENFAVAVPRQRHNSRCARKTTIAHANEETARETIQTHTRAQIIRKRTFLFREHFRQREARDLVVLKETNAAIFTCDGDLRLVDRIALDRPNGAAVRVVAILRRYASVESSNVSETRRRIGAELRSYDNVAKQIDVVEDAGQRATKQSVLVALGAAAEPANRRGTDLGRRRVVVGLDHRRALLQRQQCAKEARKRKHTNTQTNTVDTDIQRT